jgi:hypothetical protein
VDKHSDREVPPARAAAFGWSAMTSTEGADAGNSEFSEYPPPPIVAPLLMSVVVVLRHNDPSRRESPR